MELTTFNFWGKTKYWWGIMLVGILLIPAGLWLLFQPVMGYAVISMLLGWGLILFGVVQLTVSGDIEKRGQGWGWWLDQQFGIERIDSSLFFRFYIFV